MSKDQQPVKVGNRVDHAAAALRIVEGFGTSSSSVQHQAVAFAAAQVQATLALVEQQRIANHIAYVSLLESQYAEAAKHPDEFQWETHAPSVERHSIALDRIREGLGL